jgi:DNA-binding IclR family transcriptional regulator
MIEPIAEPIAPVSTLSEKLLATVNSLSGVRLSDLEATVGVSRSELVQALQQLIRSGDVVQRDRSYYRA